MAKISDFAETLIKQLIDQNDGVIEITRGELADRINCVPSQINYVLATRFTNGQGYLVESRRGGGGWIRIRRVTLESPTRYLMHTINSLGVALSEHQADVLIRNFLDYEVISTLVARVLHAATSDRALREIDSDLRDHVRMTILKNTLASLIVRSA
ncbi:MAG: CtsR family transcriptional regulator [Eubacteriales bacterium]|nr:CtsR family transcriptional regulator [Eubacteriales bacterium]